MGCGESWRELFDVVIAKANKPDFYTSEHPFRFVSFVLLVPVVLSFSLSL